MRTILLLSITVISLNISAEATGIDSGRKSKKSVADLIVGTWVMKQNGEKELLRYVRAEKFELNTRGFVFHESGHLTIYEEFGCQLPPNFRVYSATWEVSNNKLIIIDDNYPGEKPRKMKLAQLDKRVLKFTWK